MNKMHSDLFLCWDVKQRFKTIHHLVFNILKKKIIIEDFLNQFFGFILLTLFSINILKLCFF